MTIFAVCKSCNRAFIFFQSMNPLKCNECLKTEQASKKDSKLTVECATMTSNKVQPIMKNSIPPLVSFEELKKQKEIQSKLETQNEFLVETMNNMNTAMTRAMEEHAKINRELQDKLQFYKVKSEQLEQELIATKEKELKLKEHIVNMSMKFISFD